MTTPAEAALEAMAGAMCRYTDRCDHAHDRRKHPECALAALVESEAVRVAFVTALESNDTTAHAGSPRGISDVYCYVPVLDAVDVIRAALSEGDA